MRLFRGVDHLPDFKNTVVTIGMFDGVHIGHQVILDRIKEQAKKVEGETVLLTFDPHPRYVLSTNDDFKLITTLEEKIKLLENYRIDNVVVIPFTEDFYNQLPENYIKNFLVKYFKPSIISIGYDHRFGKDRKGDFQLLKSFEREFSFEVLEIEKQLLDDIAVSSSKVRNALLESRFEDAKKLLNHEYSFSGKVIKGRGVGKEIGFPTANIQVDNDKKLLPSQGVYAVKVKLKGQLYIGMMNIGHRPTFDENEVAIEIHLLDFEENIYGNDMEVIPLKRLRDIKKFDSKDALRNQLQIDLERSKAIF